MRQKSGKSRQIQVKLLHFNPNKSFTFKDILLAVDGKTVNSQQDYFNPSLRQLAKTTQPLATDEPKTLGLGKKTASEASNNG
ncbi:hypothetical protein H6F98_04475 [Microcoleus sp. FACHB-SPT15]|jgi:hypothetical protein|nr:hypothetical protein [Microcoleus sp. FACHB-SPT15]